MTSTVCSQKVKFVSKGLFISSCLIINAKIYIYLIYIIIFIYTIIVNTHNWHIVLVVFIL